MRSGSSAKPRVRRRLGVMSPAGYGTGTLRSARRSPTSRRTGFVDTGGGPASDISVPGPYLSDWLAGQSGKDEGTRRRVRAAATAGALHPAEPTRRHRVAVAMLTRRPRGA